MPMLRLAGSWARSGELPRPRRATPARNKTRDLMDVYSNSESKRLQMSWWHALRYSEGRALLAGRASDGNAIVVVCHVRRLHVRLTASSPGRSRPSEYLRACHPAAY